MEVTHAFNTTIIQQLVNEAEYLMKNYRDQGGCYSLRP